MFDERKFWLTATAYVLICGVVIASAAVGVTALVGMFTKEASQQAVTPTEPAQGTTGIGMPTDIKREPAASASPPPSPNVQRKPPAKTAVTTTPSRPAVPDIQIIAPERRPAKGNRSGF